MTATPAPIRVALIGYGYAGRTFHAPLIGAVPELDLRLVASRDAAKVQADLPGMAVVDDPLAAIAHPDIDLVVIATPNDSHAPLARAAIAAGKHVVVEKPFALDMAEARELVALAKARGVVLSVFHNRRWDSDFLTVRQAIASDALGTVSHFESHFDRFRPQVRERWREAAVPGSGVWFDLGPHLVDQALLLFGLPDRVMASLARQRPGAQTDDWAHVVLEYPTLRVVLHAGMLVAGGWHRFTVHGSKASMVKTGMDQQEAQLVAGMKPGAPGWGEDPDAAILLTPDAPPTQHDAVAGDQRGFYRATASTIAQSSSDPVTSLQALAVMAVVEAAATSAKLRKSVEPELSDAEQASLKLQYLQA